MSFEHHRDNGSYLFGGNINNLGMCTVVENCIFSSNYRAFKDHYAFDVDEKYQFKVSNDVSLLPIPSFPN
jgi:hypothetical protein